MDSLISLPFFCSVFVAAFVVIKSHFLLAMTILTQHHNLVLCLPLACSLHCSMLPFTAVAQEHREVSSSLVCTAQAVTDTLQGRHHRTDEWLLVIQIG